MQHNSQSGCSLFPYSYQMNWQAFGAHSKKHLLKTGSKAT